MFCYGSKENANNDVNRTNDPDILSDSGETDPESDLRFILDPSTIPVVPEPRMYAGSTRGVTFSQCDEFFLSHFLQNREDGINRYVRASTIQAPPGLPVPSHLRKRGTNSLDRITEDDFPPSAYISRERLHCSTSHGRMSLASTGSQYTTNLHDDSQLMRHLSDSQRTKARALARYYRIRYNFRAIPLPLPFPMMEQDRKQCAAYLVHARNVLNKGEKFDHHRLRKHVAEEVKRKSGEITSWNICRALAVASEEMKSIAGESGIPRANGIPDAVIDWSERCLTHKARMEEQSAKQKKLEGYMFLSSEFGARSSLARKAWLRRMEGNDEDSEHGEEEERKDSMAVEKPKTVRREVADARKPVEQVKYTDLIETFGNESESEAGSDDYSVYSEYTGAAGVASATPGKGKAKAITMVRAAEKPSLYMLKKASASVDTIMPES